MPEGRIALDRAEIVKDEGVVRSCCSRRQIPAATISPMANAVQAEHWGLIEPSEPLIGLWPMSDARVTVSEMQPLSRSGARVGYRRR